MRPDALNDMLAHFNDPAAVAQYAEGPLRFVPRRAPLRPGYGGRRRGRN